MKKYPTLSNPLYLTVAGEVPSMKNRRVPFVGTTKEGQMFVGIRKENAVIRTMARISSVFSAQFAESGFDTIELPHRVGVHAVIYKLATKNGMPPKSDLDNQYTTLQELLPFSNVIENDRQIAAYCVEERLVSNPSAQRACLTVFLLDKSLPFVVQLSRLKLKNQQLSVHSLPNDLGVSDEQP